jgi:hypothetical protein
MNINIDPHKVISFFGGREAVQKRLQKAKVIVSLKAIEKWCERSNMPASRFAQLAYCAKKDGREFDLYDFIAKINITKK